MGAGPIAATPSFSTALRNPCRCGWGRLSAGGRDRHSASACRSSHRGRSAGRDRRLGLPPRWRWRSGPSRACRPSRPQAAILAKSENVLGAWHSVLTMEIIEEDSSLHHRERSEEHTSELQSLMRTSYAVFCLKKKKKSYMNLQ